MIRLFRVFVPVGSHTLLSSEILLITQKNAAQNHEDPHQDAVLKDRLLLVGESPLEDIGRHIEEHPDTSLQVVGYVNDSQEAGAVLAGGKGLSSIALLREIIEATRPDRVVVGMAERRMRMPAGELLDLRFAGPIIEKAAGTYEKVRRRVCLKELRPSQFIYSGELGPRRASMFYQTAINLVLVVIGVVLAMPMMLLVALAVRLTSAVSVPYRQVRVGMDGHPFTLYKFRSMRGDAEAATGRVTPVGRIIRKLRVDEIPQLFNVLKDEMSIVEPRPERPEFVHALSAKIAYYRQRHCVGRESPAGPRSITKRATPWKTPSRSWNTSSRSRPPCVAWLAITGRNRTTGSRLDNPGTSGRDFDLAAPEGIPAERSTRYMLRQALAVLALSIPAMAQYAGPAILSRGEAPAAMATPEITFRPYFDVTAVYDTGLAGVATNQQGGLANSASAGVQAAFGVSGAHSWRHTRIGLDYHGSVRHYFKQTYYDSTNHTLLLDMDHQFSRHVTLSLRESAGMFSRDYGLLGLSQAVGYDPSQTSVPTTDYFDNRTMYLDSQANLTFQKSARLSFNLGGDGSLIRYRSTALYGANGATARADVQYRVTHRTTIGANYTFNRFAFPAVSSQTDIHGAVFSYSTRLSRWVEFSGYGGVMRVESKFIQSVPVDPAITALLGVTVGSQLTYHVNYLPSVRARLSRSFQKGVAYAQGTRTVTPGNGLFLTSTMTTAAVGYTYTGVRHWSFDIQAGYDQSKSLMNFIGQYRDYRGGFQLSHQLTGALHVIAGVMARQYDSGTFSNYNRLIYDARVGFGFSPGDVPVKIW